MTDIKKTIICGGLLLLTASTSFAIPARRGFKVHTQPDGSLLNVELRGDEYSHCYVSEDGFPLLSVDGELRYAMLNEKGEVEASAFPASDFSSRSPERNDFLAGIDRKEIFERLSEKGNSHRHRAARANAGDEWRGLFPGTFFPVRGKQKALVILVEYADVKMTLPDAADYFSRMLNEEGFSDYGATGSVADYFRENSSGVFDPQFDLYGPVTLANNRAYYGGNDFYGRDQRPQEMVIEACRQLEGTVNFSDYDRDGDGVIDNVFIFYAGEGESNGVSSETVWPHSYNISSYPGGPYVFDGVVLDRYACSYEWDADHPDGVGTFIHEFSHVMGLPDLYATVLVNSFTPGPWSVMDYGPYNNNGRTPPLYSVFERNALGWIDPLNVKEGVDATLYPVSTNQGGIILTPRREEYYLIENRQKEGWDEFLPGHGMLVWHVDYDHKVWASNAVNNNYGHQRVDLVEADWEETIGSRAGDAFPGTAGITEFTDDTCPSMETWKGERLGIPLTEIAERQDGAVTFKISGGGSTLLPPAAPVVTESDHCSLTLKWEVDDADDAYVVRLYSRDDNGELSLVTGYASIHVGSEGGKRISGLEPSKEYFVTLARRCGWEESAESDPCEAETARLPLAQRAVEAIEASDPWENGFTAHWIHLEDAESYLIDIYTKRSEGPYEEVCDFTEGTKILPEGWSASSVSSYANEAYSGENAPSLRLSNDGDFILTPGFAEPISSISFWHRGNSTSADDNILVEGLSGNEYVKLVELPIVSEKGGSVTILDGSSDPVIPSDASAIKISYMKSGSKGALALDDIKVAYGDRKSIVEETRITDRPAGNGEAYQVVDLLPSTDYYYVITALGSDGERSLPSKEIAVTTLPTNGVVSADASDSCRITVSSREICISNGDGERVAIIGTDGVPVGECVLNGDWKVKVAPGIYIVNVGSRVFKIAVD